MALSIYFHVYRLEIKWYVPPKNVTTQLHRGGKAQFFTCIDKVSNQALINVCSFIFNMDTLVSFFLFKITFNVQWTHHLRWIPERSAGTEGSCDPSQTDTPLSSRSWTHSLVWRAPRISETVTTQVGYSEGIDMFQMKRLPLNEVRDSATLRYSSAVKKC